MIRAVDNASVLALAQYANEKLALLVDQLDNGSLAIEMHLGVPFFSGHESQWAISIAVKENEFADTHGDWVAHGNLVTDSDHVDYLVQVVEKHLAAARLAA